MKLFIRNENLGDAKQIHDLTREAFGPQPYSSHTEQFIVDALRQANALTVSLVAELDAAELNSQLVGHVAISPVSITNGSDAWFGLGPISVHPTVQGKGVGSRLMAQSLGDLRKLGAAGCVLLGNPAYYSRFGFEPVDGLILADVPKEYFQALLLNSEIFPQGEVSYHAAFSATE